jgi:glucose dehydrogenase
MSTRWRRTVAGMSLVAAVGLAAGGCGNSSSSTAPACASKPAAAGGASAAGGSASPGAAGTAGGPANPAVAAGWTLPGGNLANTRDVASAITSSDVSRLGVAWCVQIQSTGKRGAAGVSDGYATTPVVVNGVVYLQDLESNVMAIRLATGKVLWTHDYNSINGGPDGVNVAGGVVYAATDKAAGTCTRSTPPPARSC